MMLFFLEFRIWHNGFFNYIFVFSFCVLPMLLHTCPSNKKIRKNTDTLRHALWDSLSCFGRGLGFCRFLFMHRKLEKKILPIFKKWFCIAVHVVVFCLVLICLMIYRNFWW